MTYKVANISDPGTSIKHGADDLDKVAKLLNGTASDAVEIKTSWKFSQTGGTLLKAITAPSSPASGFISVYVDTADGRLKGKKSDGTIVILESDTQSGYSYIIYKNGSTYYAKSGTDASVLTSSSSFYTVITTVISALSSGGTILIGPGDFSLTSQLVITQNNLRIRGLGYGVSRILYNMSSETIPGIIVQGSIDSNKSLTVDSDKGTYDLTVASTTGIAADDWVYLVRNVLISDDDPDTYDAEIHKVDSVTSTVITLKNKIYAAYNTADSARVNKITWVDNFQLEDITLYDNRATVTDMDGNADTIFRFCRRPTIKNVVFDNMVFGSCGIQNCYDTLIDGCQFLFPRFLVGINYGLYIMSASTNTKVNNITGIGCRHTVTTGPVGGPQATTFGPGRQRGLHVTNSVSSLSNTADFDTHEGCVGAVFSNCGAIGGDIDDGLQTQTAGFNTRNPTTFIGCWTEGTYGYCSHVFSSNNNAGTEEIPGGDETIFDGCQFRNPHTATGLDQNGIFIDDARSNITITNCNFHNIIDKSILIGSECSKITITNNRFIGCGTNNSSSEGIIQSTDYISHVNITNNYFGDDDTTRPLVITTGIDKLVFCNNDVSDLTNKTPIIPAASGFVKLRDNIGLNSIGKITNAVDSTNHVIAFYGGDTAAVIASQDYQIEGSDIVITSTGGTGVSITIKDFDDNTVASGLTTLSAQYIPNGFQVNFGGFSVAPTVTVFGN